MADPVSTVLIVHPDSPAHFLRINEQDYDASVHTLKNASTSGDVPEVSPAVNEAGLRAIFDEGGWQVLKRTAEGLTPPFEKPEDQTWEESIPAIARHIQEKIE